MPAPGAWYDREETRMETVRFPKEKSKQEELADQRGSDGWHWLPMGWEEESMPWRREVPAMEVLRRVWVQPLWGAMSRSTGVPMMTGLRPPRSCRRRLILTRTCGASAVPSGRGPPCI